MLSLSIVTAVLFTGLAVGSAAVRRFAQRTPAPLRWYAALELAIATYALATYPLLGRADWIYGLVSVDAPESWRLLAKALHAIALLLLPTMAMGATLPLVCAHLRRTAGTTRFASLYAVNTLGAVAGTVLCGLVVVPALGLAGCLATAVVCNITAACLGLLGHRQGAPGPGETPTASSGRPSGLSARSRMVTLAALAGASAMVLEVVFTRLLQISLHGTVETATVVLAAFLTGIAIGSAMVRRVLPRHAGLTLVGGLLLAEMAAVMLCVSAMEPLALATGRLADSGGPAAAALKFLLSLAVLVLPAAVSGALMPATVALGDADSDGTAVADALAANTAGGVLGSLLTGVVLIPYLGSAATLYLALLLLLVGALLCASWSGRRWLLFGTLGMAAVTSTLWSNVEVARLALAANLRGQSWHGAANTIDGLVPKLTFAAEGAHGVVTLLESPTAHWTLAIDGQVQANRSLMAPHFPQESVLLGLIPAALAANLQSAYVIGLGAGVTVETLLAIGCPQVTVAELEPRVVEALTHVNDGAQPLAEHGGFRLLLDDGRDDLRRHRGRPGAPRYDIIVSQPTHWWLAGVGSLATTDFYQVAYDSLHDGGVYVQWLNSNRMTEEVARTVAASLRSVFDAVLFLAVQNRQLYYLAGVRGKLQPDQARANALLARARAAELADGLPGELAALGHWIVFSDSRRADPLALQNGDDDSFVESHLARTSARTVLDLATMDPPPMDKRGPPLALTLGDEVAWRGLLVEAAEQRLGTHGGSPRPDILQTAQPFAPTDLGLARVAVAALEGVLDECWRSYFAARLVLAGGALAQAQASLAKVCEATPFHMAAGRARGFAAVVALELGRCTEALDLVAGAGLPPAEGAYLRGLAQECAGQPGGAAFAQALVDWRAPWLPAQAMLAAARQGQVIPPDLLTRAGQARVEEVAVLQTRLLAKGSSLRADELGALGARLQQAVVQRRTVLQQRATWYDQRGLTGEAERAILAAVGEAPGETELVVSAIGMLERYGKRELVTAVISAYGSAARDLETARRVLLMAGVPAETVAAGLQGSRPAAH